MQRFVRCLTILATTAGMIGCASGDRATSSGVYPKRASGAEILADAPEWLTRGCRSHWKTEAARRSVVCGIGSAQANRNHLAARDTAVARARSAIARSISVTIENLVRIEDSGPGTGDGELRSIVHQLTSASLPACQVESVWRSKTGETHALVSLRVARVQESVRASRALPPAAREDLARRAGEAFAELERTADGEPADADRDPLDDE